MRLARATCASENHQSLGAKIRISLAGHSTNEKNNGFRSSRREPASRRTLAANLAFHNLQLVIHQKRSSGAVAPGSTAMFLSASVIHKPNQSYVARIHDDANRLVHAQISYRCGAVITVNRTDSLTRNPPPGTTPAALESDYLRAPRLRLS